ncbi:hypothetical protein FS842_001002 [Serendipita sp. 407]|nr:hypothetical protein FS842_001002 [Serendipita sp. 407]
MSNRSTGRKQGSQTSKNIRTTTTKRQRGLRSDEPEDQESPNNYTTTNHTKRRRRNVPKDNERYKEAESDKEPPFSKQTAAFMHYLDKANTNLKGVSSTIWIPPVLFETFFEALQKKDPGRLGSQLTSITELLDAMRDETAGPSVVQRASNGIVKGLQGQWEATVQEIFKPDAPSTFAKSAQWVYTQAGPAGIDCLRPANRSSLPISLLHPAFATFKYILTQPMPRNDSAVKATRTAWKLCTTMADHFQDENARKTALFTQLRPLFTDRALFSASFGSADPDGALVNSDGSIDAVVELKNEPGAAGDVYMQCARSFDALATSQLQDKQGAERSAFVISVDGPSLLICGGFKDRDPAVVEPLSQWCSMLPDDLGERQEVLGKHLYALQVSLYQLKTPPPGKVMKCPRIYKEFQIMDGSTQPFEFISPYKHLGSHCGLLFKAKTVTTNETEEEVLVKVVRGGYGEEAHRIIAENGFAPKLYGVARVDGAPPAYAMELLSERQLWMPLQRAWFKDLVIWDRLEAKITDFLHLLRKHRLVHGDLRPNNVLCRMHMETGDVQLGVLDWDWAGSHGIARYPLDRNPDANLPGDPGGLIDFDHDSTTLMRHFQQRKSSVIG